jgi:hypothetical protein
LRSACLEWLCQTLCNYAGYLDVSTLHTFKINIFLASLSTDPGHRNFSFDVINHYRRPLHATHLSRSCWVSSDTGHHRLEAYLRLARLQGLLEVGPLNFSSSFRSIGSLLPIGRHSTTLWFGKTSNRPAAKLICSFSFFGPTFMLFDLSIAIRLRQYLLSSLRLHLARGLVRHGYPWVLTDQAHSRP